MEIIYQHAKVLEKRLQEANVERLTNNILSDATSILCFLSLLEERYENIGVAMTKAKDVSTVADLLIAVANGKSDEEINLLVENMLFPQYVGIIWDTLQKSGIDIGLSRDALEFQIDAARSDFPYVGSILSLCESPITLKQALESLLNYDDNRLKRFLDFILDTYGEGEDVNKNISA